MYNFTKERIKKTHENHNFLQQELMSEPWAY